MLKFYRQVQVKFMEIQKFIHKMKNIMEMLIQLGQDRVMMKVKDVLKHYLWIINREHKLKIKIIRIFNTFGPNMAIMTEGLFQILFCKLLVDKELTVNGDGTQTRSFQYIDDLIEGMIKMMNTSNDFTGPVNIGNPNEISMNKLAATILRVNKFQI